MLRYKALTITLLLIVFGYSQLMADKIIEKMFDAKKEIQIKLVLGDCEIGNSTDSRIHVTVNYTYDDEDFEAIFDKKNSSVIIREKIHGDNAKGESHWTINLPKGLDEVKFETATGGAEISDIKVNEFEGNSGTGSFVVSNCLGEFELNTGTGRIVVESCKGEFQLNSGTGSVRIENSEGELDANSGTGKVRAENIIIIEEAELNSGTGSVLFSKPQGSEFELSINSGTGDATLDMDGEPIEGYFEFRANHGNDIHSPIDFDDEKSYHEDGNGHIRKWFKRAGSPNRYFISTGTGDATLEE